MKHQFVYIVYVSWMKHQFHHCNKRSEEKLLKDKQSLSLKLNKYWKFETESEEIKQ